MQVPVSQPETFHLRLLVMEGAYRSWEAIRTIDGVVYDSFQEAALAKGLVSNDNEFIEAIVQRRHDHTGHRTPLFFKLN